MALGRQFLVLGVRGMTGMRLSLMFPSMGMSVMRGRKVMVVMVLMMLMLRGCVVASLRFLIVKRLQLDVCRQRVMLASLLMVVVKVLGPFLPSSSRPTSWTRTRRLQWRRR
jgi:hypothetical protein